MVVSNLIDQCMRTHVNDTSMEICIMLNVHAQTVNSTLNMKDLYYIKHIP